MWQRPAGERGEAHKTGETARLEEKGMERRAAASCMCPLHCPLHWAARYFKRKRREGA